MSIKADYLVSGEAGMSQDLLKRGEFGNRLIAFAPIPVKIIVLGAKLLAKHEMGGLHIVNFERLLEFSPLPTFFPPAGRFR